MKKITHFDQLPLSIQEIMLQEQEIQTGKQDPEVFKYFLQESASEGGFSWRDCSLGKKDTTKADYVRAWIDAISAFEDNGDFTKLSEIYNLDFHTTRIEQNGETFNL